MYRERCRIIDNQRVAPGHYVLRLASPRIARRARPGAFVQILCSDSSEPLLPRPFSFLTAGKNDFSVLYQVVGKGTRLLSQLKKDESLWVVGPLGNGFTAEVPTDSGEKTLALVGGGVGIPPLYHLAENLLRQKPAARKNLHVFLGARHQALLLCEKDFKKLGVHLHLATDDGSRGKKGFVTALLEEFLKKNDPLGTRIYTCGPTPMLKAVSTLAGKFGAACEVSVEVPMACGFGACLGCAIKVTSHQSPVTSQRPNHRFAIACCEGPVFRGEDILWD